MSHPRVLPLAPILPSQSRDKHASPPPCRWSEMPEHFECPPQGGSQRRNIRSLNFFGVVEKGLLQNQKPLKGGSPLYA